MQSEIALISSTQVNDNGLGVGCILTNVVDLPLWLKVTLTSCFSARDPLNTSGIKLGFSFPDPKLRHWAGDGNKS